MGILAGRRPKHLGVDANGLLAINSNKPNFVHSQIAEADPHYIAPFVCADEASWAELIRLVKQLPRTTIITSSDRYCHAECATPMGFVDDLELVRCGDVAHVKSAARLGYRDFGVNRTRVQQLRSFLHVG